MPESLEMYAALDAIRRDVARLSEQFSAVEAQVEEVRVAHMATLATSYARDSGRPPEVVLKAAGMTTRQIGAVLGKQPSAVRMAILRFHRRGDGSLRHDRVA